MIVGNVAAEVPFDVGQTIMIVVVGLSIIDSGVSFYFLYYGRT